MSGIAGIVRRLPTGVSVESLGRMAAAIRHRGPDGYGFFVGSRVGFAHVRLSIVDVDGGSQPLANEDGQVVVTYNGEIYNHQELRHKLEDKGHVFRTRCDTEVLVHGYEEWGVELLARLNGDFAFAIYDRNTDRVFLARDRFGVRPLFYAQNGDALYFGSEIKAILACGEVEAIPDRRGLDEVFTFSAARPPRTPFAGIASLEPGTYGLLKDGALWLHRYYELDFPEADAEPGDVVEQIDELMLRSVGMRMRADVPVGAYISAGLDAAMTASLAASASSQTLRSFSVTTDECTQEEDVQRETAANARSVHAVTTVSGSDIVQNFPQVAWHTETPLLATAPVAMFRLAKLARDAGIKAVIGGDGADELFLGSDVFKEDSVRRFCSRQPESRSRQRLFSRICPDVAGRYRGNERWRQSLMQAAMPGDPLYSHLPRFVESGVNVLYSDGFRSSLAGFDVLGELRGSLPVRYFGWSPLNQAAYLEMTTFFSPNVLSSQGDRVTMAHGVEGRSPFLDHRLFEFSAALPTGSRLRGLREKEILRRWASRTLPAKINRRQKRSGSEVDAAPFFGTKAPEWTNDLLGPDALRRAGIFSPTSVNGLLTRCRAGFEAGAPGNKALVGVLSTQLWHHQFIENAISPVPLPVRGASVVMTEESPAFTR